MVDDSERFVPAYIRLYKGGELQNRARILNSMLSSCTICPHQCKVNRLKCETGICKSDYRVKVASAFPHFGEEPPITGTRGSGTIFFSNCNLRCVFCQNYDISNLGEGKFVDVNKLAQIMVNLQNLNVHNINLVTPTHYIAQIISALIIAIEKGLKIPIVYNSSGYESLETLKILDGIVDIYMPDFKFISSEASKRYTTADDYPEAAKAAILEMHRQVGDLKIDKYGVAYRGLLIRHLVLPGNIKETKLILKYISENLPNSTYVNIMNQYQPAFKAYSYPEIDRSLSVEEYREVINQAKLYLLTRGTEENI